MTPSPTPSEGEAMLELAVAKALFQRDVDEDVCDSTWEENAALHGRILADARAAITAIRAAAQSSGVREATREMTLAGARSIGNTMHTDNHIARALECWRAMWSARDGVIEPIPQGRAALSPNTPREGER